MAEHLTPHFEEVQAHYDLSDDFFQIWLGPDMVYSCGWWDAGDGPGSLVQAQHRLIRRAIESAAAPVPTPR